MCLSDVYINTPTLKDYINVVKHITNNGILWSDTKSDDIHEDYWHEYGEDACIVILDSNLFYCSRYGIGSYDLKLLTLDDIYKNDPMRRILKDFV